MKTANGFVAAELGALMGALIAGLPSGLVAILLLGNLAFADVPDWILISISTIAVAMIVGGSCLGCRWLLNRRGFDGSSATALTLVGLLAFLYLVGALSSGTALQSRLFPWLAAAAPAMPLIARALVARVLVAGERKTSI
jgi:hypothetical protein